MNITEDEIKMNVIIENAFKEFCDNYSPTKKDDPHAILRSSGDLEKMFQEFTGLNIDRSIMAELMTKAKFTFKLIGDEFLWLLKDISK